MHPGAMLPDGRVRLCRTPSQSSHGSTVSHAAVWGFRISMVEKMPKSRRFVATMLLLKFEKCEKFSRVWGVTSKSVVRVFGSAFCRRYRSVTVGNGNLFRSDCQTLDFNWIRGQKIKVAQGSSGWLKVNQGILKHFFLRTCWTLRKCGNGGSNRCPKGRGILLQF